MKRMLVSFIAAVFAFTAIGCSEAKNLVQVEDQGFLSVMVDSDSVTWAQEQVYFNYYVLPRIPASSKQIEEYFGVKNVASARYDVILDLYSDRYQITRNVLTDEKDKVLLDDNYSSDTYYKTSESSGVSSCLKVIVQNKMGLDSARASAIGMRSLDAGNYVLAVPLLEIAAEEDLNNESVTLGDIYASGRGVGKDYKKAFQYYSKAYEKGNKGAAACGLGILYYDGSGVRRDYDKAMAYFKESADHGYNGANTMLGRAYYEGKAVKKDSRQARDYLARAIENGDNSSETSSMYAEADRAVKEQEQQDQAALQAVLGLGAVILSNPDILHK